MSPEEAITLIQSIDISRYPSGMDLEIEVEKLEDSILCKVNFTVESNREPYETIRLNMSERIWPKRYLELDIVRRVRNLIAGVLLHELDESIYIKDKRVCEPHYSKKEPELVITPCLCSSYICEHSEGLGIK